LPFYVLPDNTSPTSHVPQEKLAEVAALFPDCRLVTIPDAGHIIHLTRPEEYIALLRDFLGPWYLG
jgi:pimeloyl-ACP methyl ester carboxylesterase